MTVVHIVLFKFRAETCNKVKAKFVLELKKLKFLPSVQNQRLVVGGPSITTPISRSQGYHFCLLSYHRDRKALEEYQASAEHHHVTNKYMWPFNEDLTRFDFELDSEDEGAHGVEAALLGSITPPSETNAEANKDGCADANL